MGSGMPTQEALDLVTLGRVSLDLFSKDIGAPFHRVRAFETGVGGSPANIAVAGCRLGLNTALLSAVGHDEVGRFVLQALRKEGVDTSGVVAKTGARTGMALVGVQPPERFPLVFYRENPADVHLGIDDVSLVLLGRSRALLVSGTALSRGACRDAALFALQRARSLGVATWMDLDLRTDQWSHPLAFGVNIDPVLPQLEVVIGTEEEWFSALSLGPPQAALDDEQRGLLHQHLQRRVQTGLQTYVVKKGAQGATFYGHGKRPIDVAGVVVQVKNTVGAGDAFAGGLIYGRLHGWNWARSVRLANACGAWVVARHGCSKALPTFKQARSLMPAGPGG